MDLKRYKRPKNSAGLGVMITTHIKEPFLYREKVEYDLSEVEEGVTIVDQFLKLENVLPLGYPTEQYLFNIKNDVHKVFSKHKLENKGLEDELKDFDDPADLKISNKRVNQTFFIFSNNGFHKQYTFTTIILDALYNNFRKAFRECISLTLRLYPEYPNINMRATQLPSGNDKRVQSEMSKVGYNPCLDRRIHWELFYIPNKEMDLWMNQMYIVDHIDIKYAFKTKINKIENKDHLVMREEEGIRREEDFIPADTHYKTMLEFMLNKKFESLYVNRLKIEEKEQSKLRKQREREEKKKRSGSQQKRADRVQDPRIQQQRSLNKTFKHLVSKEGLIPDQVVNKNDIIFEANKKPLCILVIGKPRAGKTRVSQDLSKSLDLVHINIKNYMNILQAKVANYEPPDDLSEGKEAPKFLNELEEEIHHSLLVGKGPDEDQQIKIIAEMVTSPEAQTKGYILDLPFNKKKETWYDVISRGGLCISQEDISYIIELDLSDKDIQLRAKGIRFDPVTGEVVSKWEREERRKPKKKKRRDEEGEGEGEEEVEEEEEFDPDDPDAPKKPKILQEEEVLIRIKDLSPQLDDELQNYNAVEAPSLRKLIDPLYHHQYIQLDCAGMKPEIINDTLVQRIKRENTLLRPIAIPLEAEGDSKSYLTSGKEEGELPRKWSLWKQTDPVALFEGKVVEGQTDFAASFNDRVFLFENEENQKAFCERPKKYLKKIPEMPKKFRLLLSGPTGVGKKTAAKVLAEKYGWKVVDWNKLV